MKNAKTTLAVLIATAFVGSAAFAQTDASTPAGATPTKPDATSTKPDATSTTLPTASPESRADVKAQAKAANRSGNIPKGEAAVSKKHPKGGAVGDAQSQDGTMPAARAEVKDDAGAANRLGDIPKGEADVKIKP